MMPFAFALINLGLYAAPIVAVLTALASLIG